MFPHPVLRREGLPEYLNPGKAGYLDLLSRWCRYPVTRVNTLAENGISRFNDDRLGSFAVDRSTEYSLEKTGGQ